MNQILKAISNRSGEPSSWVGAALLAALSVRYGPGGAETIINALAAVFAAVAVVMPEKGDQGEKAGKANGQK